MPIPTTNASEELPAINQILASVGQAPVTTLDQTNPDVAIAYDTLTHVSREVQAEGWTFNTEEYVKFTPDSDNEIQIANNILQIDLHDEVDNQYENGKTYLEKLEAEQGDKTYSFQIEDQLKKQNKANEFKEFLRLLEAGTIAVNPLNNIKYIKKDGKYFTAGDELDPTREITYKQATGQDLPNPNQT